MNGMFGIAEGMILAKGIFYVAVSLFAFWVVVKSIEWLLDKIEKWGR